ncbi:MAG: hypothetical protein R3A52_14980 [Polyangiales bacterium]
MAKRSAPKIDPRWGHRLPSPLPTLDTDDPFLQRVQKWLRDGGGDVEVDRAILDPSPALRAFMLRYLALPESADLGDAPWNQSTYDALDAATKRALRRTHNAVEAAVRARAWGLYYASRTLLPWPEGRAAALERFRDGSPAARFEVARACFDAPEHLTLTEYDALATLLDGDATPDALRAIAYGARAVYARDPDAAFERLAPMLPLHAAREEPARSRAIGVLLALRTVNPLPARWGDALRPLLGDLVLGGHAVWALDGFTLDESWVEPLLSYLHLTPGFVNVWDRQALTLLSRVADARTTEVFVHALAANSTACDVVLTAFERHFDDRAREALSAWYEARTRAGALASWAPYARAQRLLG